MPQFCTNSFDLKKLWQKKEKKVKSQTEWKYLLSNIICFAVVNITFLWQKKKNHIQIALLVKDYKMSIKSTEHFCL